MLLRWQTECQITRPTVYSRWVGVHSLKRGRVAFHISLEARHGGNWETVNSYTVKLQTEGFIGSTLQTLFCTVSFIGLDSSIICNGIKISLIATSEVQRKGIGFQDPDENVWDYGTVFENRIVIHNSRCHCSLRVMPAVMTSSYFRPNSQSDVTLIK